MSAANSAISAEQTAATSAAVREQRAHLIATASTASAVAAAAVTPFKNSPNLSAYCELSVEQRDRIYIITFNRPAVRNALTRRGYYELMRALGDAVFNETITTIVLTGAAGCFTAGNDLTQTRQYSDLNAYFRSSNAVLSYLTKAFIHCPKVLVALVDGPCVGIGFVLAALCDVVYCTERAYFTAPFTQLGLCPEGCASYLLPQLVGRVKASELLLFGARLSAEDALRCNFVARLVPAALVESELLPQLMEYARLPVESLRATKRLLTKAQRIELERALKAECKELERLRRGATYQRTLKEFMERKGSGLIDEIIKNKL